MAFTYLINVCWRRHQADWWSTPCGSTRGTPATGRLGAPSSDGSIPSTCEVCVVAFDTKPAAGSFFRWPKWRVVKITFEDSKVQCEWIHLYTIYNHVYIYIQIHRYIHIYIDTYTYKIKSSMLLLFGSIYSVPRNRHKHASNMDWRFQLLCRCRLPQTAPWQNGSPAWA